MNKIISEYLSELKRLLLYEFENQIRSGVYGFTQRMISYNSNRIEGSTLSEKHTVSLFETGTIYADGEYIRGKDIEEMTGHFTMFNHMLETFDETLTEELIKKYHFYLKIGVFEDKLNGNPVGEYKNRRNFVSNIAVTEPKDVEQEMRILLKWWNSIESPTLKDFAMLHAKYENIHPFQDGNGRTGRIILFKECLKNNIVPFVIEDSKKYQYYKALNEAQNNHNFSELISFFENEQSIYFDKTVDFVMDYKILDELRNNNKGTSLDILKSPKVEESISDKKTFDDRVKAAKSKSKTNCASKKDHSISKSNKSKGQTR